MGNSTHAITLSAASGDHVETIDALVDTGATFTTIPSALLERLGVVAHRTVSLKLANGRVERRQIGEVRAELDGAAHTTSCVFGEPNAPPVIGAHTLEAFLLAVDPEGQRLVPVEGLWV